MSVGVDTTGIPTDTWGWLPLLTVAAVDVVREHVDAGAEMAQRRAGGHRQTGRHPGRVANPGAVVVGIGLNVSLTADELPDPRATSLELLGATVDRSELAAKLLRALTSRVDQWRAGEPALVADYHRYSLTVGTWSGALLPGDAELLGTAVGIDEFGRLQIDDGTSTVTVSAGDHAPAVTLSRSVLRPLRHPLAQRRTHRRTDPEKVTTRASSRDRFYRRRTASVGQSKTDSDKATIMHIRVYASIFLAVNAIARRRPPRRDDDPTMPDVTGAVLSSAQADIGEVTTEAIALSNVNGPSQTFYNTPGGSSARNHRMPEQLSAARTRSS